MRPRLLTIPFSHFCEKARWALDHAGVSYTEDGHVPGFHRVAVRRAGCAKTAVPVLVVDGRAIEDSTDILAWVDARSPAGRELYPKDEAERREVLELEDHLDRELGPHLRRLLYFHLLPSPRLARALMNQGTPLWQRAALRVTYPGLSRVMRRFMEIDAGTAEESRERVFRVLSGIDERLSDGRRYLVGDRFSAADLTLAALAAPAIQPPGHPTRFPPTDALPARAQAILSEVQGRPVTEHVRRMYRDHRA